MLKHLQTFMYLYGATIKIIIALCTATVNLHIAINGGQKFAIITFFMLFNKHSLLLTKAEFIG